MKYQRPWLHDAKNKTLIIQVCASKRNGGFNRETKGQFYGHMFQSHPQFYKAEKIFLNTLLVLFKLFPLAKVPSANVPLLYVISRMSSGLSLPEAVKHQVALQLQPGHLVNGSIAPHRLPFCLVESQATLTERSGSKTFIG